MRAQIEYIGRAGERDQGDYAGKPADPIVVRPEAPATPVAKPGETIAELVKAGLVHRSPDPTDGRRILVSIAELGRERLLEDRRRREGWLAEAIASELDGEELAVLERALPLLDRLAQH